MDSGCLEVEQSSERAKERTSIGEVHTQNPPCQMKIGYLSLFLDRPIGLEEGYTVDTVKANVI
jgi:hypothetical protein